MFPSCFLHVFLRFPLCSPYAFLRFPSCFYYVSVGGFVCFWDNCSNKSLLNKRNNNSNIFTTEYLSFDVPHRLEFKFIFISIFQVPPLILSGSAAYIYLSIYLSIWSFRSSAVGAHAQLYIFVGTHGSNSHMFC